MNQKELNELRRRFRLDKNNFSRVYGCYVNSNREIIAWVDTSMGLMRQEEQEMYLGLLKKSLSGTLGKNLIDVVFSTQQVADSDEHRLLQTLRQTELKDPASRETLCRQIIDCIDMGEKLNPNVHPDASSPPVSSYTQKLSHWAKCFHAEDWNRP